MGRQREWSAAARVDNTTGLLPAPPARLTCCSTDAAGCFFHGAAPLVVSQPGHSDAAAEAWRAAVATLRGWERTVITTSDDDRAVATSEGGCHAYLHAECSTLLCGYVDDLELRLRPAADGTGTVLAVRSASRLGLWDFG